MLKRRIGTLILITCLILTTMPAVLGAQMTVSPTSGTDAQTAINSAINSVASGATSSNPGIVLLTAGTYKISGPIVLKSNVVLKGAGDSTIIYASSSVCNSEGAPGYVFGSGVSNVDVSNMQFQSSAAGTGDGGHGDYRNCIKLSSCSNCKVHDILFKYYLYCDGVRTSGCSGIAVYNCRIGAGHDGICFFNTKNSRAYNNDIDIRTNTGIRVDGCTNVELDHNTFYGLHGSGWCCTEMESSLSGINIHHNIFHDYSGSAGNAAVQPVHASGSVSVHDNVLWNVGSIAFGTSSNNIINPSDKNVANWVAKGYGYGSIGNTAPTTPTDPSTTDPTNPTNPTNPTAQQLPVATFISNVTSGSVPLNVAFTDTSTNSPTSWNWDFGDGATSTTKNTTHKYLTAGSYKVTLTVTNAAGSNTTTKSNYLTVIPSVSPKPVVALSASPTTGNAPLNVAFTDTSTNSPTAWNWNFGDGTTSTIKNPTHTYSAAGTYTVSLTASNTAGSNTATKTSYITATAVPTGQKPVVAFSASPTSGNAPLSVIFTDASANSPTAWKWTFGDGTTSTEKNPTHKYTTAGSYTVTLTATNAAGSNTATKSAYIKVTSSTTSTPVAAFSGSPISGNTPLSVAFTDKSTGSPASWKWSFGDNIYSTAKNPVHKYTKAGTYTVSLTVKNTAGSSSILKKTSYIIVK